MEKISDKPEAKALLEALMEEQFAGKKRKELGFDKKSEVYDMSLLLGLSTETIQRILDFEEVPRSIENCWFEPGEEEPRFTQEGDDPVEVYNTKRALATVILHIFIRLQSGNRVILEELINNEITRLDGIEMERIANID